MSKPTRVVSSMHALVPLNIGWFLCAIIGDGRKAELAIATMTGDH